MVTLARKTCREMRLRFWERWLAGEAPHRADREKRLDPARPLPDWIVEALPADPGSIRILDLAAGPLSSLGTRREGLQVELVPIDDLAHWFDRRLLELNLKVPVPTRFCAVQDVLAAFGPGAFDLITTFNGLDFEEDPVEAYRELLKCLKPHGKIITFHETGTPADRIDHEWFRFFHVSEKGRVVVQQKAFRCDLADSLPDGVVQAEVTNGLLRTTVSRRNHPLEPDLPILPAVAPREIPMISLHLPKTAGSSFRALLESIYGDGLRTLYRVEETDPKHIDSLPLEPGIRCLHGHFQADSLDRRLPGALKVTWLRDPVERVVSSYFQFQRHPESAAESSSNARLFEEGWSLMEFARQPEMRRQVLWHINAVPLEAFFFIGITERYDESLRLFCHLLGVPAPEPSMAHNANPLKGVTERYPLCRAQRDELEALYAGERVLYQQVNDRLDRLIGLAGS